jgi:hypothetical protein
MVEHLYQVQPKSIVSFVYQGINNMTNLNQVEYNHIRDEIAKQIAFCHYRYNAIGVICNGVTYTRDQLWNMQSEEFKNNKLVEAQAALGVMASIGYQNVIAVAFDKYLEEK